MTAPESSSRQGAPGRSEPVRCAWVGTDPDMRAYHDEEWGVPVHEDRRHFELLILEGAQAGLSWRTVLRKREGYRRTFAAFDPAVVARFGESEMEALLRDPGIVRNRLKIRSAVLNARAFLQIQDEFGSFDRFVWEYTDGTPRKNEWRRLSDLPAETEASRALSRDLKKRGFRFVGPTIMYAYMQAAGLVNDHVIGCFRREQV